MIESKKFSKPGYWWVKDKHQNVKKIVLVENNSSFLDNTYNIYEFYADTTSHEDNFEPIDFISEANEDEYK
jgi:hypothetical protein